MIYVHCTEEPLPPSSQVIKGKPHLQRLLEKKRVKRKLLKIVEMDMELDKWCGGGRISDNPRR